MNLYTHQKQALDSTRNLNRVAFFHPMGSGKTFTGSEKLKQLDSRINLVICQKSKIEDWVNHFQTYYKDAVAYDLSKPLVLDHFFGALNDPSSGSLVGIINYDLVFRRKELLDLADFTLLLDESSLIQNSKAKRTRFISKMNPTNVILLSGTPVGGKYERLVPQMHLLGWKISEQIFYNQYVKYHYDDKNGFPVMIVDGYKNVERLKRKMREHGCDFLTQDDLFDLPKQVDQIVSIPTTVAYRKFVKDSIVSIENGSVQLVGDTTLLKLLYERQLCGQYNLHKVEAFRDLLESTGERLIVFYNFNAELKALQAVCEALERPVSLVNGAVKDLSAYESESDSVTFIQYQAGAMGLNLQKANRIIYFTPPLSSELFEQSKKRIHRIGQSRTCFYYYLTCKDSIEGKIYRTLAKRRDYTEALFKEGK